MLAMRHQIIVAHSSWAAAHATIASFQPSEAALIAATAHRAAYRAMKHCLTLFVQCGAMWAGLSRSRLDKWVLSFRLILHYRHHEF